MEIVIAILALITKIFGSRAIVAPEAIGTIIGAIKIKGKDDAHGELSQAMDEIQSAKDFKAKREAMGRAAAAWNRGLFVDRSETKGDGNHVLRGDA